MNPKFRTYLPGRKGDQHHLELVERPEKGGYFRFTYGATNLLLQHAHLVRCAHGQHCTFKRVARIYPGP